MPATSNGPRELTWPCCTNPARDANGTPLMGWNGQQINGARVVLTITGCEQASGRPTIQRAAIRHLGQYQRVMNGEVHQAGSPIERLTWQSTQ